MGPSENPSSDQADPAGEGGDLVARFIVECCRVHPERGSTVAVSSQGFIAAYFQWSATLVPQQAQISAYRVRRVLMGLGFFIKRKRLGASNLQSVIGLTLSPDYYDRETLQRLASVAVPTPDEHHAACSIVPLFQPFLRVSRACARTHAKANARVRASVRGNLSIFDGTMEQWNKTASVSRKTPPPSPVGSPSIEALGDLNQGGVDLLHRMSDTLAGIAGRAASVHAEALQAAAEIRALLAHGAVSAQR